MAIEYCTHGVLPDRCQTCKAVLRKTLRDDFAAAALTGLLSDMETIIKAQHIDGDRVFSQVSEAAFKWADAMIEARKPKA